jgi:hypothetical protein
MKQTAVDWLRFELLKNLIELQEDYKNTDEIWKKAKDMERRQIKDAYSAGVWEIGCFNRKADAKKYYEENYGKK